MKKSPVVRLAIIAALAIAVSACSYYVYPVEVERRGPSTAGLDVAGKTMSVSFVQNSPTDSVKQSATAEAFAAGLDKLYSEGVPTVELFSLKQVEGADYADRDTLVNLVMSTDSDVAFLFDEPNYILSENSDTSFVMVKLYAYDSLSQIDSVLVFTGRKKYSNSLSLPYSTGKQLSAFFESNWEKETFNIYMYDDYPWRAAAMYADNMEWDKALDKWLEIASSITWHTDKRAYASYNAALACYMLGNYEYALKWLDAAEKEATVNQAASLRAKIKKAIESR